MTNEMKKWEVVIEESRRLTYLVEAKDGGDAVALALGKATLGRTEAEHGVIGISRDFWHMTGLQEIQ